MVNIANIKVVEENKPSEKCKDAFGKIAAKSLIRILGIEECKRLAKEYYESKEK